MVRASSGDLAVFSMTAPPSPVAKTALRGILVMPTNSTSALADAEDLSIGSRLELADSLETVRGGLQRLIDIGRAMRQGQKHIVLGMKERAMA
jgi:hypothetical protein